MKHISEPVYLDCPSSRTCRLWCSSSISSAATTLSVAHLSLARVFWAPFFAARRSIKHGKCAFYIHAMKLSVKYFVDNIRLGSRSAAGWSIQGGSKVSHYQIIII